MFQTQSIKNVKVSTIYQNDNLCVLKCQTQYMYIKMLQNYLKCSGQYFKTFFFIFLIWMALSIAHFALLLYRHIYLIYLIQIYDATYCHTVSRLMPEWYNVHCSFDFFTTIILQKCSMCNCHIFYISICTFNTSLTLRASDMSSNEQFYTLA